MLNLSVETWLRFLIWLVIGFAIYFSYSYWHSRLLTHAPIRPDMLEAMETGHAPRDSDDHR